MFMRPSGLGNKNDCAGEGEQQFSRQTELNYNGATNTAPTEKDQILPSKRRLHF
jgi:hypothetical protein